MLRWFFFFYFIIIIIINLLNIWRIYVLLVNIFSLTLQLGKKKKKTPLSTTIAHMRRLLKWSWLLKSYTTKWVLFMSHKEKFCKSFQNETIIHNSWYHLLKRSTMVNFSWLVSNYYLAFFVCIMFIWKKVNDQSKFKIHAWVPVSSTGKISNGCIRDLGFNPYLHQKLIGVLVWW